MSASGEHQHEPAEQKADRQAADIAEKQARDRPIERRKPDDRAEQGERDEHGAGGAPSVKPSSTTPAVTGTTSATVIQSMPSMKLTRLTNQTPPSRSSARSSDRGKLRHDGSRPAASR